MFLQQPSYQSLPVQPYAVSGLQPQPIFSNWYPQAQVPSFGLQNWIAPQLVNPMVNPILNSLANPLSFGGYPQQVPAFGGLFERNVFAKPFYAQQAHLPGVFGQPTLAQPWVQQTAAYPMTSAQLPLPFIAQNQGVAGAYIPQQQPLTGCATSSSIH